MKRIVLSLTTAALLFSSVSPVFAQIDATTPTPSVAPAGARAPLATNGTLSKRDANLKTRAQTELQRRIEALTQAKEKLTAMKHLDDSMKTALSTQVQTEI